MGVEDNIGYNKFPKQGSFKGRAVRVCFNYDTTHTVDGIVIRCDEEEPGRMIILLGDGRVVLSTECQYQLIGDNSPSFSSSYSSLSSPLYSPWPRPPPPRHLPSVPLKKGG